MGDEDLRRLEREVVRRGARYHLLTRIRVSEESVPCRVWQGRRDWDPSSEWTWRTPVATIEGILGVRARFLDGHSFNQDSAKDRAVSTFSIWDAERREILNLVQGYHSSPSVVVDGENPSPPPSDGFGRFLADADGTCSSVDLDNLNDTTQLGLAMLRRVREATTLEKKFHMDGAQFVCDMLIGAHPCEARFSTSVNIHSHQEIGHRGEVREARPGEIRWSAVPPNGAISARPVRDPFQS